MTEAKGLPIEVIDRMSGWLLTYKDVKVMRVGEEQELLVFRPPTRLDNTELTEGYKYNAIEAEHKYIEALLLWPEWYDFDDMFDADFNQLLNTLWTSTIFGSPEKFIGLLNQRREERQNDADAIIEGFICAAFKVTPSYVDKLTERDLIDHLVLAENILGTQIPLQLSGDLPGRTDVGAAQEAWMARKMERRARERGERWDEGAAKPDAPPPQDGDDAAPDGAVDTQRENALLYKMLPHLRFKPDGQRGSL